jgi:regulation of enolase protein 1 (concanavalin A-like superfamily)
MKRSAHGGDTSFIAGASVPASTDASGNAVVPVALALTRDGNTVSATYCVSGSCTPIGSTEFPAGQALVGIAVTSHNPGALNNAVFNPPPFAATGTGVDIGEVGTPGYATFENATGTYFVSGAGSDIWGTADSFHAVLRDIVGDSVLSARVVSEDATNPFAKAGLVIGDSTASGARVILDVKPDGGIEFMARSTNGASMSFIAGSNGAFPVWLRLTRTGDQFTAETSSDGSAWTSVGTVTVTMPADTFGGFAVTSHDPSTLNNAVFDELGYTTGRRFGPVGPNLLVNGGFEESIVPNTAPGWVSDTPLRQTPAVTETTLPHTGAQDAVCRTTSGDCGIYQDIDASTLTTGNLWFTIYARADHPGALVGVNIDGKLLGVTRVVPGDYQRYDIALTTYQVAPPPYKTIRVWMYAPPAAGVVAIDDVEFVEYYGPR